MKKTIIGISVIAILHTGAASAENRNECTAAVNAEYLALVDIYKSTGSVPSACNGGRLAALCSKIQECIKSGIPVASACAAGRELCCGSNIDYVVTGTTNNVETCTKHSWNAATSQCSTSTIYRCAIGYYGNPTTSSAGCTKCPLWSGVYHNSGLTSQVWGTTASAGQTAATGCYITSGTYYDATGKFQMGSNCQYK